MAYGAKYIATFSDIYQNTTSQYTATIFKKDYSDAVYEISLGGTPLTMSTDSTGDSSYRSIIASTATLSILSEGNGSQLWNEINVKWEDYNTLWNSGGFNFTEFLTAEPDTFYIDIKKGANLIWRGYYITTSDTYIDEIQPIEFTMQFSDLALSRANQFGYDDALPPAPTQLATVSFNSTTGGNLTFDASTSSGLSIDTTTGGFNRIKNTTANPIATRISITLNCTNNLDLLDIARFSGYVVNDSSIFTIKYSQVANINSISPSLIELTWDFGLDPNDGVYFSLQVENIIAPFTPVGSITINTNSGAVATTIQDLDSLTIKYAAKDKISINDLIVRSLLESKLGVNIRINSSFEAQTTYGVPLAGFEYQVIENNIENTYILKNSLLKNINEYMNFYDILDGLCNQFGLVAFQKNGIFYVTSYDELVNNNYRFYKEYNGTTGAFVQTLVESDTIIELNSSTFRNIGQSQTARYCLPYKFIDLQNNIAKASNQDNCYMKVGETRYMGIVSGVPTYEDFISNWDLNGYVTKNINNNIDYRGGGLWGYARNATAPLNIRWGGGSIYSIGTSQDDTKYLQTLNPVNVKQGDFLNISFSYGFDARLEPQYRPETKIAVVLQYPDPLDTNNKLTFYLNSGRTAFVPTLSYQFLTDRKIDISSLKMPRDGQIYLRMLLPWSSSVGAGTITSNSSWMFVDYAMLQVYSGSATSISPGNVTYRTSGSNVNNNKDSLQLNSTVYFYDRVRYESSMVDNTTPLGLSYESPLLRASSITNLLMTEFYDPIGFDLPISTTTYVNQYCKPIYYNTGLTNMTINGTFKSSLYGLGSKFSYSVAGFPSRNYVLLDYKNDLKQSTQDVILYSSQFSDSSTVDIETVLVTE